MISGSLRDTDKNGNVWSIFIQKILEMTDMTHSEQLEVPKNMHILEYKDSMTISYSWFKFKYFVFFVITPLCSLVLIQSEYIVGSLDQMTSPVIIIMTLNVVVMYYCLTRLLNTTKLYVNHDRISIKHGPLPLVRDVIIKRGDLAQLYVAKQRKAHRYYLYSTTYQVNAILKNNEVITLLNGIYQPDQGRFIERKIEHFLGITDVDVDGEIDKD